MSTREWQIEQGCRELAFGYAYSVARLKPGDGSLSHIDQPVVVGASGQLLVMLSTSGGIVGADPQAVVTDALRKMLDATPVGLPSSTHLVALIRNRLNDLLRSGKFFESVPNGIIVAVADHGDMSCFRFGPVAVADVIEQCVEVVHKDDRFPALRRIGVSLEDIVPGLEISDARVLAVTSLTQLEYDAPYSTLKTCVPHGGSLMLLSRGSVPFTLPGTKVALCDFSQAEAGWMHGMSGVVVQIYRPTEPPAWNLFPWIDAR